MKIGYARVSTGEQDTRLQLDALKRAGCGRIFEETGSGAKNDRLELQRVLDIARKGDLVIVWKLDRLGRSLRHLIDTIAFLEERGVGFRSLTENIDTTSTGGRLVFISSARLPSSSAISSATAPWPGSRQREHAAVKAGASRSSPLSKSRRHARSLPPATRTG